MSATPDTSDANVASVLREAGLCAEALALHERHETQIFAAQRVALDCRALADALGQQATVSDPVRGALTWEERVHWVMLIVSGDPERNAQIRIKFDRACRAAFPELAPTDD